MYNRIALNALVVFMAGTLTTARAQTSSYQKMTVAGDWQNWSPSPANMSLTADNTWQADLFIYPMATSRYKFVADEDWTNTNWGDTDQGDFVMPITGTAEIVTGSGNDIIHTNPAYGVYRFTFNDATRAYSIEYLHPASGTNLLRNPGFEDQGSNDEEARYWEWGNPDPHGGKWGSAARRGTAEHWRAHSGSWEGTIQGTWAGADNGGWWQEVPGTPGESYRASAWFWADNNWTAGVQQLKIEFYDENINFLADAGTDFYDVAETWVYKSVSGTAPGNAAWVRIVVYAGGVGPNGALQFDDLTLRHSSYRNQNFNDWDTFTNDGCHELDWMVCTGKVTTTDALSGYSASLPNPAGVTSNGNYVQSPYLAEGIGSIRFYYRHGSTDTTSSPAQAVAFRVLKSADATNWTTIAEFTNVLNVLDYNEFGLYQKDYTSYYVRIEHCGGSTNRLLLDDITISEPSDMRRFQQFNDWPDSGTNYGYHTYDGWIVDTGRVSTLNAYDDKSLELPAAAHQVTNYVCSPFYTDGYGRITFYYARGTNNTTPIDVILEVSYDSNTWTTLASVTNVTSASYNLFNQYFYQPTGAALRIRGLSHTGGTVTVLVDEHFDDAPTPPPEWEFHGITQTYTGSGYYGQDPPAIKFNDSGDYADTPYLSSPTNLSFWLRGAGTDTASSFRVETFDGSTWSTSMVVSPLPTSGTTYSTPLSTNTTRIRFYYTKSVGNAGLDDVLITGIPVDTAPQGLFLDDINIEIPAIHRLQDFDSWPSQTYGDSEHQGWQIHDVLIGEGYAWYHQAARIKNNGAWICSPYLPEGLGSITFYYRRYSTSGADPQYEIQSSADATNWTAVTNLTITGTNYQQFSFYVYDTTNHFMRLIRTSGDANSSIAVFDEIQVALPSPPADVDVDGWHEPSAPWSNDEVNIFAHVVPHYGAVDVAVTTYYRIGTSGVFSPIAMQVTGTVNYVTVTPIAPQPTGTVVQYYIRCDFSGPGSRTTSPRYYPDDGSNSPASYIIPRSASGQVWINEINYVNNGWTDEDTNEFVELCGPAGFDLSGWKIELVYSQTTGQYRVYATYILTNGASLHTGITNGYGFYVIGDVELPQSEAFFSDSQTCPMDGTHLSDGDVPSGVRLSNESGAPEWALSYAGNIVSFTNIAAEEDFWANMDPYDLQLSGSGTNYSDFSWSTNAMTPGAINAGQTLEGQTNSNPPEVVIVAFELGTTNVTIWSTGTNGWTPQPWYTTNLPASSWIAVSPYWSTYNSGTDTVWFDYPVTSGPCFFRIQSTNAP